MPIFPSSPSTASLHRTAHPLRCLVVDDDSLARRWLTVQLEALGLQVAGCNGARDAQRLLRQEVFPLVFLDCVLDDGDGYAIARSIRQQKGVSASWIVGLSASTGKAHERACQAAGMDAVLCKPASTLALTTVLAGRPGEAVAKRQPAAPVDVDLRVQGALRAACVEESDALKNAVDATDAARVRYHAHRLRGTALLGGMSVIAAEAAALETAALAHRWSEIVSIRARMSALLDAGLK